MGTVRAKSVIESLNSGFALVFRRPYLMVLPILLDLLLWRGPKLVATPLARSLFDRVANSLAGNLSPEELIDLSTFGNTAMDFIHGINLLAILAWHLPSVSALEVTHGSLVRMDLPSWHLLWVVLLAVGLLAALLGALYLRPLAVLVRHNRITASLVLRNVEVFWGRFILYLILVLLLLAGIVLVSIGLAALAVAAGPGVLSPVVGVSVGGLLLLSLYLFLGEEAVFAGEAGPVQALKESFSIVRRNFWSVVWLFLLANLITQGLGAIWFILAKTVPGFLVGMVGNSFVGTGIAAAIMIYYWERRATVLR